MAVDRTSAPQTSPHHTHAFADAAFGPYVRAANTIVPSADGNIVAELPLPPRIKNANMHARVPRTGRVQKTEKKKKKNKTT